ncbi:MAG: zinc-binding dehydrogenase [Phycisphaeraceae bacterium]
MSTGIEQVATQVDRETMMAGYVDRPRLARVKRVPMPEPGPGQVRVRIRGCGVCASNVPPWEGRSWFRYPMGPGQLGHEGWGVVDRLGAGVTQLDEGQPVALLSQNAYAQFDVAEEAAVIPIPAALAEMPLPGEPLGCAMNIWARSQIREGQTVAIVGAGFLGALLTQLASKAGANVIAISRRQYSLEMAERMGAAEVLPMGPTWSVVDAVRSLTHGELCDRVIEATGKQEPLELAGEITRERGRLIIAGFHQDGPRAVNMQLWNWRGLDVVNAHEREERVYVRGIMAAMEAVADGQLDPFPLYTHRFPLEQLGEALELTRNRPAGFIKALMLTEQP